MQIEVLKSKIHRVSVTEANLDYVGSVTIDEELLEARRLKRLEMKRKRKMQQRIILGVLAFVILHSMGQKQEVEVEEELSVESLLQSTQEPDVGDIEVETKSETRKMIEKFVDDNPESAANLLRNWLNEDWG